MENDEIVVYTNSQVVDPAKMLKYGNIKNIQQVRDQLHFVEHLGIAHAGFDTLIGGLMIARENESNHLNTMVEVNHEGKPFVRLPSDFAEQLLSRIDREVLQDASFQRAISCLNQMDVSLVPLNTSGQWHDVPELGHDQQALNAEILRKFSVHIEGVIEMTPLQ